MDGKQLELIQTVVAMFKAAPGARYLSEFTTFINNAAVFAIEGQLNAGESRGGVIHWAATALASVDTADIHWGAAAAQFTNKVEIASFYSIDQSGQATSLTGDGV